jgi:hypothetical protein
MKQLFAPFAGPALILSLVLWSACTKSTPFGSTLLEEEAAQYAFTDTISLNITVEPEDSVRTSDRTSSSSYLLCGELIDPVFGKTRSDLFTLFRIVNPTAALRPSDVVDSVVMFLRYRGAGVYGDTMQPQTLRVHRLAMGNQLEWGRDYYSDDQLAAGDEIGVLENFLPRPNKSDSLFTAASKAPYVRIKLSPAFATEIDNLDSTTQAVDTLLWAALRGLRITTSAGVAPGAMLAFDLNDVNYSVLRVYYHRGADARTTNFEFAGGNKFTHFEHDYSGTPAGASIGQANPDLLFVQGAAGLRLKIELPYAAQLPSDVVINKAQLQLTSATVPGDNTTLFPLAGQLVLNEFRDTALTAVPDLLYSLQNTSGTNFSLFGGQPEATVDNGTTVQRYLLTLSDYFQRAVEDSTRNTLYLSVYPQSNSVRRAVFHGPSSPTFRARLVLKYSRIQ